MTRFYQGVVMAAIVLSAGIIGQIDGANEMNMKREIHAETLQEQVYRLQMPDPELKTAMAAMERDQQSP